MPRSPEGVYTKPPGTNGGPPNTPISSTAYNNLMNDIAQDLNTPRPVPAGGTGANSALGGLDNLCTASVPIPASATTDLAGATGVAVTITGNSNIEAFGNVHAGAVRILTFEQALTMVYNADKIILPKDVNYGVGAGEVVIMVSEGDGVWRMASSSSGGPQKSRFKANKNGVNQTTPDAATIVTFDTEVYDIGGIYDAANSRFIPPAGRAFRVYAQFAMLITSSLRVVECRLLKNGSPIAVGYDHGHDGAVANPKVTDVVVGNGTDYYEIQINNLITAGLYPIRGAITDTYFMAEEL